MTPAVANDSKALAPLGVEVNELPITRERLLQENRTGQDMMPCVANDSKALAPLGVEVDELPITRERLLNKIAHANT